MLTFNICYSEALGIDPFNRTTNSKLYFNRATVHAKLGKLENSIDDCSKAIDLDNTYIKAYLRLIFHLFFSFFYNKVSFLHQFPPKKFLVICMTLETSKTKVSKRCELDFGVLQGYLLGP